MPTDLISRLSAGRFEGDNAEVLEFLGFEQIAGGTPDQPYVWRCGDQYEVDPQPLDDMNAALRLVPEGWRTCNVCEETIGGLEWVWPLVNRKLNLAVRGKAPTAAHALVLAILRAKEANRG